jgi:hypothetical protein
MSWLLIGLLGVVAAALLICFLAPSSKDRRGPPVPRKDDTPTTVARIAEESHHGARVGAVQGQGLVDGVGPFTGTLPRKKTKKD